MGKHLYIFTYQTPAQAAAPASATDNFKEESCQALFINAESAEQALAWGREISNQFVRRLHNNPALNWTQLDFAHWIEPQPEKEYPPEVLAGLCTVPWGVYPDFAKPGS